MSGTSTPDSTRESTRRFATARMAQPLRRAITVRGMYAPQHPVAKARLRLELPDNAPA